MSSADGRRPRLLGRLVLLAAAFALAAFLLQLEDGLLRAQSRSNLRFARNESLADALASYPKLWPPLYPTVAWTIGRVGISIQQLNLACLCGVLVVASEFARRWTRNVPALVPLVLLVSGGAFYANAFHLVSETFFVLCAALLMLELARTGTSPTVARTLRVGLLAAAGALTRYFGLAWLPAWGVAHRALVEGRRLSRRSLSGALAFLATVLVLTGPWLVHVKRTTGYLTGADRTSPRQGLSPRLEHWNDQVDFATNVHFTVRSLLIDLFSPHRFATHVVMDRPLSGGEPVVFLVAGALVAGVLVATVRSVRAPRGHGTPFRDLLRDPRALPLVFAASYYSLLIAIWSFSNNDPIYSRFTYPGYAFVVLSFVSMLSVVRETDAPRSRQVPFLALGLLYLASNAWRFATS